jgi:hypothetical protein
MQHEQFANCSNQDTILKGFENDDDSCLSDSKALLI